MQTIEQTTARVRRTAGRWHSAPRRLAGVMWVVAIALGACDGEQSNKVIPMSETIENVPAAAWQKLATKKIFFGHQSVGDNIMLGLSEVLARHPEIRLTLQPKPQLVRPTGPAFVHAYVGQNDRPESKNADFVHAVTQPLAGAVDMAFLKYCFVDVMKETHAEALFQEYLRTMQEVKTAQPKVMLVHFTVPLMTVQTGWKAWVKRVLGRPIPGYEDNMRRNQFNNLLRGKYAGKEPLFDLARIESTRADGSRAVFRYEGADYEALAPEYTKDGGHLNEPARRLVAEQLLVFLARQVAGDK